MRANLIGGKPRRPPVGVVVIAIGICVSVLATLFFVTPLGGMLVGALDSAAGTSAVTYRRAYKGVITKAKSGGSLSVGDRCDLELRIEDRLFGEMLKLQLACGGRGLYGQAEDMGWIAESTKRDGEVVHALDQWDDEGDPGIELKRDEGTVTYWDKTGLRLTIALEGLAPGKLPAEHDPAFVPAEKAAPVGVDAVGAMARPEPRVSDTCSPGVVCWGARIDVAF
jgi:hypothetical protein